MNTLLRFLITLVLWLALMGCTSASDAVSPATPQPQTEASQPTADATIVAATATPEPTPSLEPTAQPTTNPTPESPAAIDITISLPDGEPQNGEELLAAKACAGCHLLGAIGAGPSWKAEIYAGGKGIATRAQERWQNDGYTGQATNATEYLVESILMPNEYVITGYSQGTMPNTYREQLTNQELADIIAFLSEIE